MTTFTAQRKLGDLMVVLRKQCNLGVKELAKRSQVSKKRILQMECGIGPFVKERLDRIWQVFAITDKTILDFIQECLHVIVPVRRGPVVRSALA